MDTMEMLEKFTEDFDDALISAMRAYRNGNIGSNYRYVCQAKDFAFIVYHFGLIDDYRYYDCLKKADEWTLAR